MHTSCVTDVQIILTQLRTPGLDASSVGSCTVHTGFLNAYNAVADDILNTVKAEVEAHPGYSLVSTGQYMSFK
jgi:Lipase (class 3).